MYHNMPLLQRKNLMSSLQQHTYHALTYYNILNVCNTYVAYIHERVDARYILFLFLLRTQNRPIRVIMDTRLNSEYKARQLTDHIRP